ncbi:hypothetical protein B484DRAFT_416415, partial [Ochromonadaceae sp. CCMP2298]
MHIADSLDLLDAEPGAGAGAGMGAETGAGGAFFQPVRAGAQSHLQAISHGCEVRPSFCPRRGLLMTSDGACIVIKKGPTHVVLGFPPPLAFAPHKCTVVEAALAESGTMCAAVVKTSPGAYFLVMWVLAQLDGDGGGDGDGEGGVEWEVTAIPPQVVYGGLAAWDGVSQVLPSQLGKVLCVKALPGVVEGGTGVGEGIGGVIHAVLVGESRVMMVAVDVAAPPGQVVSVVWMDDLGARGPILGLEASTCSQRSIALYGRGETPPSTHPSSAHPSHPSLSHQESTDALVGALDSCGSVKFSVFSFYEHGVRAFTARSVTTKIPGANACGALRALALYHKGAGGAGGGGGGGSKGGHFLALASTHQVRLLSLTLRELNSHSISVGLVVLYRVAMDAVPDFLLCLAPLGPGFESKSGSKVKLGPLGLAPHLLVANRVGFLGFVPNARWVSGRHLPSECLTLQSPPLSHPAQGLILPMPMPMPGSGSTAQVRGAQTQTQAQTQVAALLCRGQLHLYHLGSGIKLPFGGFSGISHGTSLCPLTPSLFAVGSKCGRVVLVDCASMQQQ